MRHSRALRLGLATGLAAFCAAGQEQVSGLEELVGARGTVVDSLPQRGYTLQRGEKDGDSSYTFWREDATGRCVAARVANGAVVSVLYADGRCVASEASPAPGFFATVCGVIRGREPFRYRCEVGDSLEDGGRVTILRFPDNELKLRWIDESRVTIERPGLAAEQATWSTYEGETDIVTAEMTYFYISDRAMAEFELRNFGD